MHGHINCDDVAVIDGFNCLIPKVVIEVYTVEKNDRPFDRVNSLLVSCNLADAGLNERGGFLTDHFNC